MTSRKHRKIFCILTYIDTAMNILVTICARGGSKGIPGKNIKPVHGKPLIAYSVEMAERFASAMSSHDVCIALSTDSNDIKNVASEYGLVTDYLRPDHLATDTAGKYDVIKDLVLYQEKSNGTVFDMVLDLDVTSPLRTLDDLISAFDIICRNKDAINIFSVSKARKNPYFNMVEENDNGFFTLSKSLKGNIATRQSAPKVYEMNASFYFYKREFFANLTKTVNERSLIYEMQHLCFDLDEPEDYEFLSFLLSAKKIDFLI